MIDQEPWQYLLDRLQSAFNPIAHELGPVKRAWAGCQFFRFGPEGEKNFLLTSPFIERFQSVAGYSAGTKGLRESLQKPILPKGTSILCRGNNITLGLPRITKQSDRL